MCNERDISQKHVGTLLDCWRRKLYLNNSHETQVHSPKDKSGMVKFGHIPKSPLCLTGESIIAKIQLLQQTKIAHLLRDRSCQAWTHMIRSRVFHFSLRRINNITYRVLSNGCQYTGHHWFRKPSAVFTAVERFHSDNKRALVIVAEEFVIKTCHRHQQQVGHPSYTIKDNITVRLQALKQTCCAHEIDASTYKYPSTGPSIGPSSTMNFECFARYNPHCPGFHIFVARMLPNDSPRKSNSSASYLRRGAWLCSTACH